MKWIAWWVSFCAPSIVSGGGGDGGAQAAAEEDERKKARARASLNALFGIKPTPGSVPAEMVPGPVAAPRPPPARAEPWSRNGPPGGQVPSNTYGLPTPVARPMVAVDATPGLIAEADKNKTARDADYTKIFDDVLALNTNRVKDQHDVSARKNKFQIFRQGLGGGSVDIDEAALLKKTNDEALLDAGNRAASARTGAKQSDESARLDLLRQISGGLDAGSATSSAIRGMDLARENAYDAAEGNLIEGAFDNAGLIYQDQQQGKAMARGRELYRKLSGAATPGGSSYGGTLSNG